VTADDVLALLDRLDGLWLAVDGGWGVDALLGRQTREHADLDLVVERAQVDEIERTLGWTADRSDWPAVLLLVDGSRRLDLHPIEWDEQGNAWQRLREARWGIYPRGQLGHEGTIAGRRVACVSPELQLRHHLTYDWDGDDRHDLTLLAAEFGVPLPPDDNLMPPR
jgi:lincosamide nucleotidyltransferase A/C/D/E